jgi:hypothetical protein
VGTSHVCAVQYTKVKIVEPSIYRHSLRTWETERLSMGRKVVSLTKVLSTFAVVSLHVTIGSGMMNKDRVITRAIVGMLF